jgi:transcriptional regulator with XRE-family HTH domain
MPIETSIRKQQLGVDITRALGQRIRQMRLARAERLTQEELAERAEISVSFLSMIERGERAPHLETLCKLSSALGVTMGELFLFPDEEPTSLDPMVKPLADFVRTQSLTRRDVDKLLRVARVMFGN